MISEDKIEYYSQIADEFELGKISWDQAVSRIREEISRTSWGYEAKCVDCGWTKDFDTMEETIVALGTHKEECNDAKVWV